MATALLGLACSAPPVTEAAEGELLSLLNQQRQAADLPPLIEHPAVVAAASAMAERITVQGDPSAVDLSSEEASRLLEAQGYRAVRLFLGFAQIGGDPQTAFELWQRSAPDTFEGFQQAELRHFGLGLGDLRGVPCYVALAAVSADVRGANDAAALGDEQTIRNDLLNRVNQARRERRLKPLKRHPKLQEAAQKHAEDMLRRGYYGHVTPEGTKVLARVHATGYRPPRVGENLASGQTSTEQVFDGWMASPDHRANILDRRYDQLGIGFAHGPDSEDGYRFLWVQVFANSPR